MGALGVIGRSRVPSARSKSGYLEGEGGIGGDAHAGSSGKNFVGAIGVVRSHVYSSA